MQDVTKKNTFIEIVGEGLQPVSGDVKIEVFHKDSLGKVGHARSTGRGGLRASSMTQGGGRERTDAGRPRAWRREGAKSARMRDGLEHVVGRGERGPRAHGCGTASGMKQGGEEEGARAQGCGTAAAHLFVAFPLAFSGLSCCLGAAGAPVTLQPVKMFHLWFNTYFIKKEELILRKEEVDKANKDKKCKIYDKGFVVEVQFARLDIEGAEVPGRPRSALFVSAGESDAAKYEPPSAMRMLQEQMYDWAWQRKGRRGMGEGWNGRACVAWVGNVAVDSIRGVDMHGGHSVGAWLA